MAVNPNPLLVPTTQCRPHGPPLPFLLLYLLQGFSLQGMGKEVKERGIAKKGGSSCQTRTSGRTDSRTPLGGKDEKKKEWEKYLLPAEMEEK